MKGSAAPSPPLPSQLPIQRPPTCELMLLVSQNFDKALLSLFRVAQLSLDAAQGAPLTPCGASPSPGVTDGVSFPCPSPSAVAVEAQIKEHLESALEVLRGAVWPVRASDILLPGARVRPCVCVSVRAVCM